jgi:hypothetical protein
MVDMPVEHNQIKRILYVEPMLVYPSVLYQVDFDEIQLSYSPDILGKLSHPTNCTFCKKLI